MLDAAALRALAASGAVGLCTWTLGREHAPITDADATFISMLGWSPTERDAMAPLDWRTLTPDDWRSVLDERQAALLEHGTHGPREQEIIGRSGVRLSVMVSSVVVDATRREVVSLCVDLTHQMRARIDAERASSAKSRFLGVMSHELRTPLNTIIGQAELMADGAYGAVTDAQNDSLARLRGASVKLRALVDEVLLFSRLETGGEPFCVSELSLAAPLATAAAAVESRIAANALRFDVQLPAESVHVMADASKLEQVLVALLSNAIKFTPIGGRIRLDTAARAEVSDHVFVRVTDSGNGVARDRVQQIFEPFTQLDEGLTRVSSGLGLGLAISRDLARGMGGDLRVRSSDGGGATFTLSLRLATPPV